MEYTKWQGKCQEKIDKQEEKMAAEASFELSGW